MPADSSPPSFAKKKAARIGPFELVDELGVGGAARILRARYRPAPDAPDELPLQRGAPVVLKVLRQQVEASPEMVQAFSREAELLSLLDHPGIVKTLTRGTTAGRVWIALEYIEGEPVSTILSALIQARLRLRPRVALTFAMAALEALAFAHTAVDPTGRPLQLVHCDVSPRNLLVDIHGHTRLIDFGSAYLGSREPPPAEVTGTPGYLPPEVAAGQSPTAASDVYQIALVLYELLTGRQAFAVESLTDAAVLQQHADGARRPWPTQFQVPPAITEVLDQALSVDPAERPSDAAAFHRRLTPLCPDPEGGREALSLVVRDLVRSNQDRPPPFFV